MQQVALSLLFNTRNTQSLVVCFVLFHERQSFSTSPRVGTRAFNVPPLLLARRVQQHNSNISIHVLGDL